jgi:hypothetical protein
MKTAEQVHLRGRYEVVCRDAAGAVKWAESGHNLVVAEGIAHTLDNGLGGTFYVGLTGGSPSPAAGDTLASHGGWTEFTSYDGSRKAWSKTRTGGTLSNTASKASFDINANGSTIGGLLVATVATGTGGTLLAAAAFTAGNKSADAGDTLEVTYELTASAS